MFWIYEKPATLIHLARPLGRRGSGGLDCSIDGGRVGDGGLRDDGA